MIKEYEIIVLCVFFVVWLISMIHSRRILWLRKQAEKAVSKEPIPAQQLPGLSVILTTYNQEELLRKHLPLMLEQEYPAEFEVIVVDMNSSDETLQYLEQTEKRYHNLHYTSVPNSSRNVSVMRLAITLGMKAAANDWTILTNASCAPKSHHWLKQMGQACVEKEETNIVIGYTSIKRNRFKNARKARFFHFWQQIRNLRYATRHGAYRAEANNLGYRRSFFLQNKGFMEGNRLQAGATEILVNHNSTRANTTICVHPEAVVEVDLPHNEGWWRQERLFFMETRSHFRHKNPYRMQYLGSSLLIWLLTLTTFTAIATFALSLPDWYAVGIIAAITVFWQINSFHRIVCYNKVCKTMGEHTFSPLLPYFLHTIIWWDIAAWIQWRMTPKRTFHIKPL